MMKDHLEALVKLFKAQGNVALLPTETVYGLVCLHDDVIAKQKIYQMKHREEGKKLQLFVRDEAMLAQLATQIDPRVLKLMRAFCPGPLMLIMKGDLPEETIGFRIPQNELILNLLERLGRPLCATSANRSGYPDAKQYQDALDMLLIPPDYGVDSHIVSTDPKGSTIVDLTQDTPRCLREGTLPYSTILSVLESN